MPYLKISFDVRRKWSHFPKIAKMLSEEKWKGSNCDACFSCSTRGGIFNVVVKRYERALLLSTDGPDSILCTNLLGLAQWDGQFRTCALGFKKKKKKVSYFWLNTQSCQILCIVTLCSVQVYINVQECKLLYTLLLCIILFPAIWCKILYQFYHYIFAHSYSSICHSIDYLFKLLGGSIYFVLQRSKSPILLYFYTVFILIYYYYSIMFKLLL